MSILKVWNIGFCKWKKFWKWCRTASFFLYFRIWRSEFIGQHQHLFVSCRSTFRWSSFTILNLCLFCKLLQNCDKEKAELLLLPGRKNEKEAALYTSTLLTQSRGGWCHKLLFWCSFWHYHRKNLALLSYITRPVILHEGWPIRCRTKHWSQRCVSIIQAALLFHSP